MSNDTTASASEEVLALHRQLAAEKLRADQGWQRAEAKSRECIELRERAALARAPLPDLTDDEVYTLRCAAENMRSADAENSATIVDARFRLASKLEKIANRLSAAPAQADDARDAARYRWLRMNVWPMHVRAPMKWIPPQFQTNAERIDMLCDQEIAASLAGKDTK